MEPVSDEAVRRAAEALKAEVTARDQHYGLDNWSFEEVARFVLEAAATADD